jgi:preprotein translocase subunit SecY
LCFLLITENRFIYKAPLIRTDYMSLKVVAGFLPEVTKPEGKQPFKSRILWTLGILLIFFILSIIPLWGVSGNTASYFASLELLLGASIGSLLTLGIGPIVTASIVLQLLNGAGLIKFDQRSESGKKDFATLQKLLAFFFLIFEAVIFVFLGGLSAAPGAGGYVNLIIIFQLILGGFLIMLMDEVISKWGFGSGISLFIAAGVAKEIFVRAFSPLHQTVTGVAQEGYVGRIPELVRALSVGDTIGATLAATAVIATIVVFLVVVYAQAMKVEIPLSFGRIRGHGIRWPLSFFYTSNIPVILAAALIANVQLLARLLYNAGHPWLGSFSANTPSSGFVYFIHAPRLLDAIITGSLTWKIGLAAVTYTIFLVGVAVLFAYFWVQTAGLDARSQAKNIMASGLQVPGFRKDPRVLESILNRYIMPLTIMGGISVGLLAASADLLGTLTSGTGLLLAVMIIYRLYEDIAKEQMYDMNPAVRRFLGK